MEHRFHLHGSRMALVLLSMTQSHADCELDRFRTWFEFPQTSTAESPYDKYFNIFGPPGNYTRSNHGRENFHIIQNQKRYKKRRQEKFNMATVEVIRLVQIHYALVWHLLKTTWRTNPEELAMFKDEHSSRDNVLWRHIVYHLSLTLRSIRLAVYVPGRQQPGG